MPRPAHEDPSLSDLVAVGTNSVHMEKKCQLNIHPSKRTRMIKVSMTDQKAVKTVHWSPVLEPT